MLNFNEANVHLYKLGKTRARIILTGFILIAALWFGIRACNQWMATEKKIIQIARKAKVYSLAWAGKEPNLGAFSDELIQEIAKRQNVFVEILILPVDNLMAALENEYYEAIVSDQMPTAVTRSKYVFSDPFFLLGPVLLVRSSSGINSLADLKGKIVGVHAGSPVLAQVQAIPQVVIISYDILAQGLNNLSNNNIDGIILDAWTAYVYATGFYKEKLKVVTKPLNDAGLRVVARNDAEGEEFVEQFNQGLKELKANGTYKKLIDKWGLIDVEQVEPAAESE